MASCEVRIEDAALKELQSLPKPYTKRIFSKIKALASNPRPSGCTKLTGFDDLWRIKSGDYRVIYSVSYSGKKVVVLRIRHRKDVYRGL